MEKPNCSDVLINCDMAGKMEKSRDIRNQKYILIVGFGSICRFSLFFFTSANELKLVEHFVLQKSFLLPMT